jgi:hypothetical protein
MLRPVLLFGLSRAAAISSVCVGSCVVSFTPQFPEQKSAMSEDWLTKSNVVAMWKDVKAKMDAHEGKEIPANDFADAAGTLISVFDLISGMKVAKDDMMGNQKTVKKAAEADAGKSLEALIVAEIDGKNDKEVGKIAGNGKTTTCAALWLGRALRFVLALLQELVAKKDKSLSDCVYAGYEASLKPHHNFVVKGTFAVAVKAAPARDKFYAKLGPDAATVDAALEEVIPVISELIEKLQSFLESKSAASLKR